MNIEINMNINEFVECELTEKGKEEISKRGFQQEHKRFDSNFIRIQKIFNNDLQKINKVINKIIFIL